jgi:hypothetical protein
MVLAAGKKLLYANLPKLPLSDLSRNISVVLLHPSSSAILEELMLGLQDKIRRR